MINILIDIKLINYQSSGLLVFRKKHLRLLNLMFTVLNSVMIVFKQVGNVTIKQALV